ncbi:MAG: alpha/beta hydrolase [Lachnospiraceae bacterium]|nr:alpha/beta hydrolase [Lachnospiraceae bacterium]
MYDISPEFKILKKMPVVTRPLEIKLTNRFFNRLMKKELEKPGIKVKRISIPCDVSPSGAIDCPVICPVNSNDDDILPAVIFYHGGAFVFPAFPYHLRIALSTAEKTGCRVFMPFYDLAPKVLSPVFYEEAFIIYNYILEHAGELNIDPERTAVMGDSAGGTLCASLNLTLKDKGIWLPAAQLLFYPSLDASLQSDSMKRYTNVPVINSGAVKEYYRICAPKNGVTIDRKIYSPAESPDLSGMPPTYVETAEFDCLHDDGILYYTRLKEAGCIAELNETKGTVHAFDFVRESSIQREAMERRTEFLKKYIL